MAKIAKVLMLAAVAVSPTRRMLNARYQGMSSARRSAFHETYAKIFRRIKPPIQQGNWIVCFIGKRISIPLRRNSMWLDWDIAVSIVAHDPEVKQAYETLLSGADAPQLFFDVGANYGTHSLLLASQGVEAVAFEPISSCIAYGQNLANANGLAVQWEHVAVGAQRGSVEIRYPEKATWLGTASHDRDEEPGLIKETVRMVRLDDYEPLARGKRLLIKIDVEGLESEVLKGAMALLASKATMVIFEALNDADRASLYDILAGQGRAVFALGADPSPKALARDEFLGSGETNFIASVDERWVG